MLSTLTDAQDASPKDKPVKNSLALRRSEVFMRIGMASKFNRRERETDGVNVLKTQKRGVEPQAMITHRCAHEIFSTRSESLRR
jgi:hypothetical protein